MHALTRRGRLALLLCLVTLSGATAVQGDAAVSKIGGRVVLGLPGTSFAQIGPIVVFLERLDEAAPPTAPQQSVTIRQQNARFVPAFRVVVAGQSVDMPNGDVIFHNVFSYSRPNDFDLGIYPTGESRRVLFDHPGVVKVYCAIHEHMNATIFVAPSSHFDLASESGEFVIRDVPPGRYRLRTWCEKLPPTAREIEIAAGGDLAFEILLAAAGS